MTGLDERFMVAVAELAADVRENFPEIENTEWPQAHTDAFANAIMIAFRVLSASRLLWGIDEEEFPTPIRNDRPAPGPDDDPDHDPGFVRLGAIFVEVWELHRRALLDEFLRGLE